MFVNKQTLTFRNSPSDLMVIRIDNQELETDYKELDRFMRREAIRWIGRTAFTRFARRMQDIKDVLDSIRI